MSDSTNLSQFVPHLLVVKNPERCRIHRRISHRHQNLIITRDSRMLRAGLGVCPSVCPSVCSSHCCIVSKRCKLRSLNFYCGLPKGLQFIVTKFYVPGWGWSRWTRASKRVHPLKGRYFAGIYSPNVKTVADRYRYVAYYNKHWWQAF